ncbi:MAG: OmpA family protein [Bacteroidota bacterium]
MSKPTTYLLGILATVLLGCYFYAKFCCNCCENPTEKTTPVENSSETSISNTFHLTGGDFDYTCESNFNFLSDSFNYVKPIDNCIDIGISELKSYFSKNPNGKLIITGYCLNTEKNTSAFPNLGFARANDVKNYFISKGFSSNRFETKGETTNSWKTENGTLFGPVNYSVTNDIVQAKGEDWNAMKEKLTVTPLILYFNTNQTEISLTEEERQKIADLNNYLDHVADAKISCIGHTDNIGDRNVNIQLGQDRANFSKNYLVKNGIAENRIETSSKGPDEPIADNLTPEGKAKNRRTIITLK